MHLTTRRDGIGPATAGKWLHMRACVLALLVSCCAASPAVAHHLMDGEVPGTAWQGLLSGLGHPIIGIDHLAFVVAVGLLARLAKRPLPLTALFILGTAAGCLAMLAWPAIPLAEAAVAATLAIAALVLITGASDAGRALAVSLPLAGVVHGYAYGESIVGAEPTPLVAYVVGFSLVQLAIATAAGLAVAALAPRGSPREAHTLRAAGLCLGVIAAVALVGGILPG